MLYNDVFVAQKQAEGKYNQASDTLAKNIIDKYDTYVNNYKTKNSQNARLFNGLVVGNVQSGKTMNFCHVINRAIDDGFQLIVILSSNKDDLNMQTTDRIAVDIVGEANPNVPCVTSYNNGVNSFRSFYQNTQYVGIRDSSAVNPNIAPNPYHFSGININNRTPNIYWLTACDMGNNGIRKVDFDINHGGGNETLDDFMQNDPNGCYIAVVKKNTNRLKLLYNFLSGSTRVQRHNIRALFIDDECDEITVSGVGKKLGKSSIQIGDIQKLFKTMPTDSEHSMYIEYTATPIANICVKNRNNTRIGFPDNFIEIMDISPNYCGFDAYSKYQNIVNIEDPAQKGEVFHITTGICQSYLDCKNNTPKLYQAILQFILNCKIFEERHRNNIIDDDATSMLVHTNLEKGVHNQEKQYLEDALKRISEEILDELDDIYTNNGGNYTKGKWEIIDDIHDCFDDIQNRMNICSINGYYVPNSPFDGCGINNYPSGVNFDLKLCMDLVSYAMNKFPQKTYDSNIKINTGAKKIQVIEVNSNTKSTLPNKDNFIAVGGNKIARGLTLHNLSVTYFTRQTGALDTLTQMARWFGYRKGYFDICRLFIDDYGPINAAAGVEKVIQNQVKVQNGKSISPKNMQLIFSGNIPQMLSGKQVLQNITSMATDIFETKYIYALRYARNKRIIDAFYDKLLNANFQPQPQGGYGLLSVLPNSNPNPGRYCYIKDVDFNIVEKELLDKFNAVSYNNKQRNINIPDILLVAKEFMKKNNTKKVNVLLSGRNSKGIFSYGKGTHTVTVTGMAYKSKATHVINSIYEIDPFDDCPEDYLVDYPTPSTLNADFNKSVNGRQFANNRAPGYASAIKDLGASYRTEPLIIITPFEFISQVGISGTFYSIQIVMPNNYKPLQMMII